MARTFNIELFDDTGIPAALQKYCKDYKITVNAFVKSCIKEKLSRMNVHSMTVSEIYLAEREALDGHQDQC